jgi:hypothetical protein
MPYAPRKAGTNKWAITNTNNGHVAGYSTTKRKASISAAIRNGDYKPPRPRGTRTR